MLKLKRATGMKEYELKVDQNDADGKVVRRTYTYLAMNEDDAWEQIRHCIDASQRGNAKLRRIA